MVLDFYTSQRPALLNMCTEFHQSGALFTGGQLIEVKKKRTVIPRYNVTRYNVDFEIT